MIFHASIPADNPPHVARVLARLWGGKAYAFPPFPESFIVIAGDARGSELEIVPRKMEQVPGAAEVEPRFTDAPQDYSATHLAIATAMSEAEVLALAAAEGWTARVCDRGGCFHVIEVWVENRLLLEVLTGEMQAEYLGFMKPGTWEQTFGVPALG
jgi:hypothetical protein